MTEQENKVVFALGQRARVTASAQTAYDNAWIRAEDPYGRPERFVYPQNWAADGWFCLHDPGGGCPEARIRKKLWHRPLDVSLEGIVIAKSWRATGWYSEANDDLGDPPFLAIDLRHTFYEVAFSLGKSDRCWALPMDMEPIGEEGSHD